MRQTRPETERGRVERVRQQLRIVGQRLLRARLDQSWRKAGQIALKGGDGGVGWVDAGQVAFEDALGKTSTEYAPWYVIPANRKWYRNLVISSIIIDKLKSLNMD